MYKRRIKFLYEKKYPLMKNNITKEDLDQEIKLLKKKFYSNYFLVFKYCRRSKFIDLCNF